MRPSPPGRGDPGQKIRSGEARDEAVARPCKELLRAAELEDGAVDDHADPICKCRRVLEVVRNEQRRQAEVRDQLVQLSAHGAPRVRVER